MGIKSIFARTKLGDYGKAIRTAPREVLFNRRLLLTCFLFACGAVPLSKSCPHGSIAKVGQHG